MFRIDKRHVVIAGQEGGQPAGPARPASGGAPDMPAPGPAAPAPDFGWDEQARREAEEIVAQAEQQAARLLTQAEQQAEHVLDEARRQAGQEARGILDEASRQAEQEALEIRGQGWQAGYQEGVRAGREEMLEAGQKQADDLETFIEGLRQGWQDKVGQLEEETVALALAIARKIINAAINRDDEMYKALIENALNQMKREGKLIIRLPAADFSRLFPGGSAVFTLGDRRVTAQVTPDPDMRAGDCAIESDAETIDAGVESQLAAITVAFEQAGAPL